MKKKAESGIMLTLLLVSMSILAFNIQPVKAEETIYIRPDGSVEGTDKILQDGDVFTFTNNIYDSIVVQRSNIMIDGAGYTLQGGGSGNGFYWSGINNVTIKNANIKNFGSGVRLGTSSFNTVRGNNITNNIDGVDVYSSSENTLTDNNVSNNGASGVSMVYSFYNSLHENTITGNREGVAIIYSSYNNVFGNIIANSENYGLFMSGTSHNAVSENNITDNYDGVVLYESSDDKLKGNNIERNEFGVDINVASGNSILHNNFVDNTVQAYSYLTGYANNWDDGYPSGGNYWSDYTTRYPSAQELDDSGIWDTPYVIDEINKDNYPLMEPWTPLPRTMGELKTKIEELGSEGEIDNQGIVKSLIAKLNTAQKLVVEGKIEEAETILEDDFIPQVQNLTGIHLTMEAADILIKSAEYIISDF